MTYLGLRRALFALPLAAFATGCAQAPQEPGPTPTLPRHAQQATPPTQLGVLSPAKPMLGDLAPTTLLVPPKVVKGVYGRGAVNRWAEVAAADRSTIAAPVVPHRGTSKVYFSAPAIDKGPARELSLPIDAPKGVEIFVVPGATAERLRTLKMSDLGIEMTQPNGAVIRHEAADVHVHDVEAEEHEAVPLLHTRYQNIRLDQPTVGFHQVTYRPKPGVANVGAIVVQHEGVELDVVTDRPGIVLGEDVVITAKINPGTGQSFGSATMKAKLMSLGGRSAGEIELRDDGVGVDTTAGDGLFSGKLTPTSDDLAEMGSWTAMIEASGMTGEGAPFLRHATTGFTVSHPVARFTGVATESMGQVDGTPVLMMTVEIEAGLESRYRVKGILRGADKLAIAETSIATELKAGKNRIALSVPLKYLSDKPGPYSLANLELVSVDVEAPIARLAEAYSFQSRVSK